MVGVNDAPVTAQVMMRLVMVTPLFSGFIVTALIGESSECQVKTTKEIGNS
jgi:hypothetical protein